MPRDPPEALRSRIREIRRRTEAPFAVNVVLDMPHGERVAVCREERVPVVSLSWGVRRDFVDELHAAGIRVMAQVGSIDQARDAAEAGSTT